MVDKDIGMKLKSYIGYSIMESNKILEEAVRKGYPAEIIQVIKGYDNKLKEINEICKQRKRY